VNVTLNGRPAEMPRGATLADAVAAVGHDASARGVAVARNGEVARRSEWPTTRLQESDRIEILTAVQGG
jgi:sulfur carrier protein